MDKEDLVNSEVIYDNKPVVQEEPKEELVTSSLNGKFLNISGDTSIHFKMDKNKTVNEQAEDLVNLAAVASAVKDEDLVNKITNYKKDELSIKAETQVKEKTVGSKQTEKKLQEVNFGIYSGIADLIGLKKALPNNMQKVLMTVLTPILIVFYLVVGTISGIINVIMDSVNSVVTRFAEFTKPARKVIMFLLGLAVISGILLIIYSLLVRYNVIAPL